MADRSQDPELRAQELKTVLQDAFTSIAANIGDTIDEAMNRVDSSTKATLSGIKKGFRDLSKFTEVVSKTEEQALLGKLSRNRVDEVMMQRRAKEEALRISINILERNSADLSEEVLEDLQKQKADLDEVAGYNREIERLLEKQLKHSNNINKAQGLSGALLGGLAKTTKKLGLSGLDDVFANAKNDAAKLASSLTNGGKNPVGMMGKMQIAGKGLGSALAGSAKYLMGPAGIALAVGKIVELFLKINSENVDFAKTMNITAEEAASIRKELTASAKGFDYMNNSLKAARENMAAFTKQFGIVATSLDRGVLDGIEDLEKRFGLSKENALGFAKNAVLAGKSTKAFTAEIIGAAEATEIANSVNVSQQVILEDIGKLNERQRLILQNNPTLIGKAVAQARSLGLTFSNLESSASSLLDFEQSISNELEAELLLGRNLTLETARNAAITNDYATLTAEIAKNIGSAADFSNMNRLQQEALAKAVGMTADELGKVLYEQEALIKLGFKDAADRKKKFQDLVAEVGMQKALKQFGDKEYARQQSLVSIQEKLQTLLANIGNIFMDVLAPEVEKIANKFTENKNLVNDIVDSLKDFATGVMRVGDVLNAVIVKPIQATYNLIKSIVKTFQSMGQFMSMDIMGGMQSANEARKAFATSGANVLDIGTNLLTGFGVEGESNYFSKKASKINVDDFTLSSNPKDTLVMAGGTKLGRTDEMVEELKKNNKILTELLTKSGTVYMDGNKVGHTIALSTYKSN